MRSLLLSEFGNSIQRIENAIYSLKNCNGVLVLDDENRENECDILFSAENMTVEQMALTIRYGSGIVCLCINNEHRKKLNLPMMVKSNTNNYQTPFTISIESAYGVTTGVSAHDRIITIRTAIKDNVKPSDINSPGHVFPLCAKFGGLMERKGHTEAAVELTKLSGLKPAGVICEMMNDDGTMAKMPEILNFSRKYKMPILTIEDIIEYLYIKSDISLNKKAKL